jgi:hypothetical protein
LFESLGDDGFDDEEVMAAAMNRVVPPVASGPLKSDLRAREDMEVYLPLVPEDFSHLLELVDEEDHPLLLEHLLDEMNPIEVVDDPLYTEGFDEALWDKSDALRGNGSPAPPADPPRGVDLKSLAPAPDAELGGALEGVYDFDLFELLMSSLPADSAPQDGNPRFDFNEMFENLSESPFLPECDG